MDDDKEIQSHPSLPSGSPMLSLWANERIMVTIAVPELSNSLALALLIQQPSKGNSGGGGGSDRGLLERRHDGSTDRRMGREVSGTEQRKSETKALERGGGYCERQRGLHEA
ncbi:hypothetical protein VNO80_13122 [Phaseolus coccineus]|uniref:Uncharacterized protein n=1 Tax=Phaseolus coccineus TaxID=3886 RepID=A0AAN9N2I6_PHACN